MSDIYGNIAEPVVYNKEFDVTEIEKTAKRFADALEKKRLDPWDYSTELQAAYKAFTLMYSEQNYTQLHKIIGTNASGSGLIQFAHAKDIVTNAIPTDDAYREKILNAIYTAFSRDNRLTPSLVANGPLAAIDFFKTVPLNEVKSAFIVDFCRDFGVGIDYLRQALENGSVLLDARTGAKMDVTDTSKKTLAFIMNTYASLWVAQVGAVLGTAPCTGEEDNKLIFERISDGVHPLITLVDDPIPAFMPAIQAAFERTRTELDLPSN